MRRLWAAGAAILVCLALAGLPALAQDLTEYEAVTVTGTQDCSHGWDRCRFSSSDPRVAGTGMLAFTGVVSAPVEGAPSLYWSDTTLEGPEGTWSGHHYVLTDETGAAHAFMVLSGAGAYEGWQYVASGTDPEADGVHDLLGVLYQGDAPPFGPLPAATPSPALSPSPSPSPTALATIGQPADDGARIVAVEELDARTRDLTIESPSVGTVMVRLLLPSAFDARPDADWPVLYLLQGCCDTYDSWTRKTDVEELTAPTDLLVVMPAATRAGDDGFGWYTDWYNGGEGGQPAWETFHLTELRQLLERNWQAGDERVIAGLSMGGHGAMTYAARHPGMFKAAASFSGTLHTPEFDADPRVWGSRTEQADIWAAHDAVSLAPALEGLPLYVSYGTGEFGPLDEDEDLEAAGVEAWLLPQNEAFVARLDELGIPATVVTGPGTHTWPYWERGLHEAMPMLLEALGL